MESTVLAITDAISVSEPISVCIDFNLFTAISRGLIGVLVLISNVLTIAAISKAKKGIGQKGKLYILSLSCADILTSPLIFSDIALVKMKTYCLSVPNTDAITEEVVWKKRMGYSVITSLAMISMGCSLMTLASIAIDRLLAVSKPVFYRHNVTKFKIRSFIALFWLYEVLITTSLVFYVGRNTPPERIFFAYDNALVMPDYHYQKIILPHIYFCIMANISFFTITIFYIRRMDAKKISHQLEGESFKRTKTFMRMSSMTLAAFFVLWAPYLITHNIIDRSDPDLPSWIRDYFARFTYSVMFCNSWINPILYCWFNKDYREAYKRLLNIKSGKVQSEGSASTRKSKK